MLPLLPLLAVACTPEPVDSGDTGPPRGVELLPIPDMSGMDLAVAANEALDVALGVHAERAWTQHFAALELGSSGCPDLYFGDPTEPDEGEEWMGWVDACVSTSGAEFAGEARWETEIAGEDIGGLSIEAERTLQADALVRDTQQTFFSWDGRAEDSLLQVSDPDTDYARWTWRSDVDGTLRGTLPMEGTVHPDGWRSDLSLEMSGEQAGESQTLELALKGNVYLFEPLLQGNFDSLVVDLAWAEPEALGPDECTQEPRGWIGVRTPDATWFHLVFQPREEDVASGEAYDNSPYTDCDGCASLYVRGVAQEQLICTDLSWLWSDPRLSPPDPAGFLPVRRGY